MIKSSAKLALSLFANQHFHNVKGKFFGDWIFLWKSVIEDALIFFLIKHVQNKVNVNFFLKTEVAMVTGTTREHQVTQPTTHQWCPPTCHSLRIPLQTAVQLVCRTPCICLQLMIPWARTTTPGSRQTVTLQCFPHLFLRCPRSDQIQADLEE